MTSSGTSTEKRAAGSGRWVLLGLGAASLAFLGVLLWAHDFRVGPGVFVLWVGWLGLLGTGWALYNAARHFDVREVDAIEDAVALRRNELEQEKRWLLKAIKEVEFDQATGKIDPEDAAAVVEPYRLRAIEVMKLLDAQTGATFGIEEEVARRVALARAEKTAEKVLTPPVCAECGVTNDLDAAFCKKCGAKLGVAS